MRPTAPTLIIVSASVALAGCGGDDGTSAASATSPVTTSGSEQTTEIEQGASVIPDDLPLPDGTVTIVESERSAVYAVDAPSADVVAFYDEAFPPGEDLGPWPWCARDEDAATTDWRWFDDGQHLFVGVSWLPDDAVTSVVIGIDERETCP